MRNGIIVSIAAAVLAAALAGCTVPDRPRGIFDPEKVPPPPSSGGSLAQSKPASEPTQERPSTDPPRRQLSAPGAAR
jgi:hypothetical protein